VALILGTATVPSSSTVAVFTVPPGPANFTVYQPSAGSPVTVYLGTSSGVAATNGMPVPVTPSSPENYHGGRGATYYATTGSVTASSFCYMISTAT
jgi:hypothetical protein